MPLAAVPDPVALEPNLLALLRSPEPWSSALERKVRALDPARAPAALAAFIDAQLDGELDQDALGRACSMACLIRSPVLLPALVRVATSERPRMWTVREALDAMAGVSLEHDVTPALRELVRRVGRDFRRDVRSGDSTREFAAYGRLGGVYELVRDVCGAGATKQVFGELFALTHGTAGGANGATGTSSPPRTAS